MARYSELSHGFPSTWQLLIQLSISPFDTIYDAPVSPFFMFMFIVLISPFNSTDDASTSPVFSIDVLTALSSLFNGFILPFEHHWWCLCSWLWFLLQSWLCLNVSLYFTLMISTSSISCINSNNGALISSIFQHWWRFCSCLQFFLSVEFMMFMLTFLISPFGSTHDATIYRHLWSCSRLQFLTFQHWCFCSWLQIRRLLELVMLELPHLLIIMFMASISSLNSMYDFMFMLGNWNHWIISHH